MEEEVKEGGIMEDLRLGKKGKDLGLLCKLLGVPAREEFDRNLDESVKSYQRLKGLVVDGWVGYNTWKSLILDYREKVHSDNSPKIDDWDYNMFSKLLGIEAAALKAVQEVETGGKGGFLANGKPQILFEGHVFWKELVNLGINPEKYGSAWSNVLYKTWDRTKYKGGTGEWDRLELAKKINERAAYKSASWGMYQIMGNNYAKCGCKSVEDFARIMSKDSFSQFILGVEFLKNTGMVKYLKAKDWASFARVYNGSGYKQNKYDEKLEKAYNKYKTTQK